MLSRPEAPGAKVFPSGEKAMERMGREFDRTMSLEVAEVRFQMRRRPAPSPVTSDCASGENVAERSSRFSWSGSSSLAATISQTRMVAPAANLEGKIIASLLPSGERNTGALQLYSSLAGGASEMVRSSRPEAMLKILM